MGDANTGDTFDAAALRAPTVNSSFDRLRPLKAVA
jgi:hypothetical protein